jgi:hypothetical protein
MGFNGQLGSAALQANEAEANRVRRFHHSGCLLAWRDPSGRADFGIGRGVGTLLRLPLSAALRQRRWATWSDRRSVIGAAKAHPLGWVNGACDQ